MRNCILTALCSLALAGGVCASQEGGFFIGVINAGDGTGTGGFKLWAPTLSIYGNVERIVLGSDTAGPGVSLSCSPLVDAISQATSKLPKGVTRPNRISLPAAVTLHVAPNTFMRLSGFLELLPRNSMVAYPTDSGNVLRGAGLTPRRIAGTELSASIHRHSLDFTGAAQLSRLRYDMSSPRIDDPTVLENQHDDNLWVLADGAFWFFERQVAVIAGACAKNDFNTWDGTNFAEVRGGVGSDLRFLRNNLMISGSLSERFVMSRAMERKGYQVGPGSLLDVHIVDVPLPMTYLKAAGLFQVGDRSTKQMYSFSVKKVVKKFYAEGGYMTTLGVLFPRMNAFVKSSIGLGNHLAIEPGVLNYWDYQSATESFAYSRFDGRLGFRVMPKVKDNLLLRNATVSGGAVYQWYPASSASLAVRDWRTPSIELSLGIDTWL